MRLFVALPVPAETRRAFRAWMQKCGPQPALRWTHEDQLHITLLFLGEVEDARVGLLSATLDSAHPRPFHLHPLEIEFDRVEVLGRAGVLAAAAKRTPPLAALEIEVRSRLTAFSEKQESREFHPHVTLARARRGESVPSPKLLPPLPKLVFPATCFRLYRSELRPEGAVHAVLREWNL